MLEMSVVHVRRRCDGKAFHTRGPAAEKLLSPKLLCVRGRWNNTYSLRRRSKLRAASIVS